MKSNLPYIERGAAPDFPSGDKFFSDLIMASGRSKHTFINMELLAIKYFFTFSVSSRFNKSWKRLEYKGFRRRCSSRKKPTVANHFKDGISSANREVKCRQVPVYLPV